MLKSLGQKDFSFCSNFLTKYLKISCLCFFDIIWQKRQKNLFLNFKNHWRLTAYKKLILFKDTFLALAIYVAIKPYKVCSTLIHKILFDLSESSNKTLLKGLFGQIIVAKITENYFLFPWFWTQLSDRIDLWIRLSKTILVDRMRFYKWMHYRLYFFMS